MAPLLTLKQKKNTVLISPLQPAKKTLLFRRAAYYAHHYSLGELRRELPLHISYRLVRRK